MNGANEMGFLSEAESRALFDRCVALAKGYEVTVTIRSQVEGAARWARNRAFLAKNEQGVNLEVTLHRRGQTGSTSTTRIDDAGLQDAVAVALRAYQYNLNHLAYDERRMPPLPNHPISRPTLWSDATAEFDGGHRAEVVKRLIDAADKVGMVSAGDLRVAAGSYSMWDTDGKKFYYPTTRVSFSTTMRDAKGTASGWVGTDDFDVKRLDLLALGQRALEKGLASRNPVRVEPGRYTTILEPQAVADLWGSILVNGVMADRRDSEDPNKEPYFPFNKGNYQSKIGERLLDPRLTVSSDPRDPQGGFIPSYGFEPYLPVKWFDQGVLREIGYDVFYALSDLGKNMGLYFPWSYRISGGTTSVDDMVATTKRGLLVTRLHNLQVVDQKSMTCTGYTRDGAWLIENGKITKPVKNFRFVESPLFVFNRVEQLGAPQRVFSGIFNGSGSVNDMENARIAPAMKVRDFNFSQLSDAV